ncbi:MAG: ATP-binding protein [Balneolaceae bacterium]
MNNQPPDFPITGIGASAGGVKALQEFFDHLPDNSGMAFVVVIHLYPEKSSNLNKLIGSHTGMPVKQVSRKIKIRPDHVYIISPGKTLNVQDGYLVAGKKEKEEHATIDLFFRSLAAQCKEKAISGWPENIAGHLRLKADERMEGGYALHRQEMVNVEDYSREERFKQSPSLAGFKIKSSISIAVKGRKEIYGILGIYSVKQRLFDGNETGFLQSTANLLGESIERIQAQKKLKKINNKLKEAVKVRDDFLSIASHELQTPVTSMKFLVDLFERKLRDSGNEDDAQQAKKINEHIDQLSNLTRTLLDMTRMQRKGLKMEKNMFSLDELIKDTVNKLEHISNHTIEIEGKISRDIYADKFRIEQVLTNLLSNAIKYSPDADKIVVRSEEKDGNVEISVTDYGIGVVKKDREKIFKRFFKGSDSKQTYPGFGIGLYISAEIVKQHGGKIWMESNSGQGSVFSFSIPFREKNSNKSDEK